MHESIVARKLDALASEVREVRRLVTLLVDAQHTRDPMETGVRTLPDGRTFVPGTGTLGDDELSPDAQAARDQLDQERPT